jgi:hypothetical protein
LDQSIAQLATFASADPSREEMHAEADDFQQRKLMISIAEVDDVQRHDPWDASKKIYVNSTELQTAIQADCSGTPLPAVVMSSPGPNVTIGAAESGEGPHPAKIWTEIHQLKVQLVKELDVFESLTKPLKQSTSATKLDDTAVSDSGLQHAENLGGAVVESYAGSSGVREEGSKGVEKAAQQMNFFGEHAIELRMTPCQRIKNDAERDQRLQSQLARLQSEEEGQSMAEELARRQFEIAKKRAQEAKLLAMAAKEEAYAAREFAEAERSCFVIEVKSFYNIDTEGD